MNYICNTGRAIVCNWSKVPGSNKHTVCMLCFEQWLQPFGVRSVFVCQMEKNNLNVETFWAIKVLVKIKWSSELHIVATWFLNWFNNDTSALRFLIRKTGLHWVSGLLDLADFNWLWFICNLTGVRQRNGFFFLPSLQNDFRGDCLFNYNVCIWIPLYWVHLYVKGHVCISDVFLLMQWI